MTLSVGPQQANVLSLEDLEREEATRKEWAAWQSSMKDDFDKTAAFKGSPDSMVKAWERFLLVWSQDNPNSREDESLRSQANGNRDAASQVKPLMQQATPETPRVQGAGAVRAERKAHSNG